MNVHETDDNLSAYLDRELAPSEHARVQAHLEVCSECSSRRAALDRTMQAVAALPDVAPTLDESRAIRLGVIDARARPTSWRFMAGVAGATAVIVAVAGGALLFRSQQKDRGGGETSAAVAPDISELVFADQKEVNITVPSLPEVEQGRGHFKVSDVGTEQSKALASYAGASESAAEATPQTQDSATDRQAAPAAGSTVGVALEDCLRSTLRSQPHPTMPLAARPALFKRIPSWLLVFAWTNSTDANARLDRIQIWLFDRRLRDCSAPLYYYATKS